MPGGVAASGRERTRDARGSALLCPGRPHARAHATGWGREAEFACGRWIDGTVGRRSFAGDDGKHDDHGS